MSVRDQRGTALTEFVIVMLFFTPILVGMPLIAKYADIKSKTIEASRYAAWERTVWSDRSARRNDGQLEVFKSADDIRAEIDRRFFGNPVQGLHDGSATINHMWRNRNGDFLLTSDTEAEPVTTPRRTTLSLKHENPTDRLPGAAQIAAQTVDGIAFSFDRDDALLSGVVAAGEGSVFGEAQNSEFATHATGGDVQCNPLGVNITNGLNLGARSFATAEVTVLANDFMHGNQPVRYAFQARSAILGDAWSAPDEDMFGQRVDNMAMGDMAGCVTLLGEGIGALTSLGTGRFMFGEGTRANPVETFGNNGSADSRTLPRYLER